MAQHPLVKRFLAHMTRIQQLAPICPVCGTRDWEVGDTPLAIPTLSITGGINLGPTAPVVVIICKKCKHLIPFAAANIPPTPDETNG